MAKQHGASEANKSDCQANPVAPDFLHPHPRISINNFPVRFRRDALSAERVFWVPQRITRNRQSKVWRVSIPHADGKFTEYVPDHGRTPLESLHEAWQVMVNQLSTLRSPFVIPQRTIRPGRQRKPELDTGIDGVLIARRQRRSNRAAGLSVRMFQRIATPTGRTKGFAIDTVHISETTYLDNPKAEQRRFEQGLREAEAIRAHYLAVYAKTGGAVPAPIKLKDIDPRTIPSAPKVTLSLEAIFEAMANEATNSR